MVFASATAQAGEIEWVDDLTISPAAFTFTDIEGNQHTLQDYAGKWVVVNFWAVWCAPCVAELPSLNSFQEKYKTQSLEVLPLGQGMENTAELQQFLDDLNIVHLTAYKDEKGQAFRLAKARGLPTSLIFNPKGDVVARIEGEIDWMADATLSQFDAWLDPAP